MAGKKDIVEQALKLVVGSGEKVAPKVRTIRNLKGVPIAPPVEFYRGTNPGSTERIVTGAPEWDSYLFAADNPDAARLYGSEIEKITANPDAKILYEGTADWNKIAGRWRKNENMLQYADRAAKAAKEAGYDAAWFKRQSDIGTPIFNVEKFVRGQKAEGGRIAKGPGGFLDDVVRMAGKIVSGEGGEEAAKTGIKAYQGSPHNFASERLVRFPEGRTEYIVGQPDVLPNVPEGAEVLQDFPLGRMRMDKIGTGEGAQAYGHGLYFAENEPVALDYRNSLSDININGAPINKENPEHEAALNIWHYGNVENAKIKNQQSLKKYETLWNNLSENEKRKPENQRFFGSLIDSLKSNLSLYEMQDRGEKILPKISSSGKVYEVNIAADPNAFLDWDKPLSEQPEAVQGFANSLKDKSFLARKRLEDTSAATGKDVWEKARNAFGVGQADAATKALAEAGIPGIKYLDAGSRGAGDGTRNYVVFDDKLISIIRKYGIAGASAMLGYNLMERLDPKQALAATMADQEHKSSMPIDEGDDVNNAVRLARDIGGATNENPQVFLTDAQGRQYDAQGKPITPVATQSKSNSAATPAAPTPEEVGRRAANDPATFDALMQKYAIPDRDVAEYEALQTAVRQQPQAVQQMTHIGAPPMRDVKVDMPLLGGEYNIGQAPYNVAGPMSTAAQTAYDLKTAPFYMFGATAPLAAGIDVAEGVATGDPMQASLAALGAPGKFTKGAIIGLSNYAMDPSQAEAGPARWFSKAMEVAREIPMNKMTGEQALAMLRKATSPEELRWTGADVFLQNKPQVTKNELVDYLNKNRVQLVMGAGEEVAPKAAIRAYHASPHDFDKFEWSPRTFGTGEGAQSYGAGLYFAESPLVSGRGGTYDQQFTRKLKEMDRTGELGEKMGRVKIGGRPSTEYGIENDPGFIEAVKSGDVIKYARERLDRWHELSADEKYPYRDYATEKVRAWEKLLNDYSAGAEAYYPIKSRIYEVDINARPEQLLDWDTPIKEQSSEIQRAVGNLPVNRPLSNYSVIGEPVQIDPYPNAPPSLKEKLVALDGGVPYTVDVRTPEGGIVKIKGTTPEEALFNANEYAGKAIKDLMSKTGGDLVKSLERGNYSIPDRAAKLNATGSLYKEGIPGLRYLDAGSRGAGDGTRNYVVFDDKLISIIRKYGIAGASTMLGYNLMENLTPEQAKAASSADDFYQKTTNTKMDGGRVTGGNTYDNDPSVAHALALTSEY